MSALQAYAVSVIDGIGQEVVVEATGNTLMAAVMVAVLNVNKPQNVLGAQPIPRRADGL